jgi:D-sedoheptulose 7-phosphate isomerase
VVNVEQFAGGWLEHFEHAMRRPELTDNLEKAKDLIEQVKRRGAKLMFAGNGASATIASHYALDFTKQVGVRSVSFNDPALITAYGNDYGYEHWVARAIDHHALPGDVAVLISTSGSSPNIVNAAEHSNDHGIPVLAFSGFGAENRLNVLGTLRFWVDSRAYNVVEAVHGMWLGLLCDILIGHREYTVKG